ncbi:hypothetical protein ABVT39_005615 [Epinephelus coioides]
MLNNNNNNDGGPRTCAAVTPGSTRLHQRSKHGRYIIFVLLDKIRMDGNYAPEDRAPAVSGEDQRQIPGRFRRRSIILYRGDPRAEPAVVSGSSGWAVYRFVPKTSIYFRYDMNFSYTAIPVNSPDNVRNLRSRKVFQRGPISPLHTTGTLERVTVRA